MELPDDVSEDNLFNPQASTDVVTVGPSWDAAHTVPNLFKFQPSANFRATSGRDFLHVGVDPTQRVNNVYYELYEFCNDDPEWNFVCAPLAAPHLVHKAAAAAQRMTDSAATPASPAVPTTYISLKDVPFPLNNVFLPGGTATWTSRVVGTLSAAPITDLLTSLPLVGPCAGAADVHTAEDALLEEVGFATHLGLAAVFASVPLPAVSAALARGTHPPSEPVSAANGDTVAVMPPRTVAAAVAPLARAFAAALHMAKTTTLLVELPLLPPKPPKTPTPPAQPAPSEAPQPSATTAALPGYIDPWHVWSALTAAAEDSSRLSAALSLSNDDFADDSDRINGVGDDGGDSSTCVSDPARTERLALLRPHEWASPLYARPHPNSHSNANAHARAQSLPATTATGPVAKRARSTGNGVGVPARPVSLLASAPFISAPPEGSDGSGSDRHTLPLGRPPQPAPPLFIPPFCSVPANPASASAPGGETGTESVAATEAVSALAASAPGSGWRGHPYTLRPSAALARWLGANVRALIVPLSVFCLNGSGAWVLRRAHQAVLHLFWEHGVMVIVRDDEPDAATVPWREKRLKLDAAHAYIAALYAHRPALTPHAAFEAGYRDCLQTPLQPLADNLDAQTYEIFERDPVKYRNYTLAVERALRDWGHAQGRCPHARALTHSVGASAAAAAGTSGEGEEDEDGDGASSLDGEYSVAPITDGGAGASGARARAPAASRYCAAARCRAAATAAAAAVVMVVGAGRGPLVRCVIDAARRARVPVRVFALDKNPYAVLTLRARARGEWAAEGVDVAVVDADMRAWVPPALADVLVSELLGSFGDNELSPECLAGARHLLAPGGVSIPASSTSFLAPVYAPAVWAAVRAHDKPPLLETPFLVRLHRAWACAAPQQCFTFAHGPQPVGALRRRTRLTFEPAADAVVHGFAGYFSAELYGGVRLSIEPRTLSHGMFSWFPVFFPVARPLHISARRGEVLEVALARCGDARRVWYEWSAAVAPAAASGPVSAGVVGGSGQQTHVHNLLGRHSHIGLH